MAINLKSGKVETLEIGVYMARVVRILDLGVQRQEFEGEVKPSKQELQITFELPTELVKVGGEDKPRWISKTYPVSFHEKSGLTALLTAIDPDGSKMKQSVEALLDSPCQVTIGHTASGNAKVTGATQVMKGMEVAALYGEPSSFSIDEPDMSVWDTLPDWLKDDIRMAEDYSSSPLFELDVVKEEE